MIYLLGGAPRTKKTSVGERLARDHGVPFIGTDALVVVLQRVAPQLGVGFHAALEERQRAILPYVEALIECQTMTTAHYLIEGEALCPLDVPALARRFPITACFAGFSRVTLDELLIKRPSWIEFLPADEQAALPEELVSRSRVIEEQCRAAGVTYVDVSGDHETAVAKVATHLLAGEGMLRAE